MSLPEQGGELVAVLRGANAPLLQKMIVEELSKEKSVLEHGGERKTVSHNMFVVRRSFLAPAHTS